MGSINEYEFDMLSDTDQSGYISSSKNFNGFPKRKNKKNRKHENHRTDRID